MDTAPPPSDGPILDSESPGEMSEPVAVPPVVAVVVTKDPGPWLEETLESIGASDYPELTALVLDAGSAVDPTSRVGNALPGTFVRRVQEEQGFAAVANDVLEVVKGATFLLFCHDDVVLDPTAIRLLVEEGYRSNAAILGPKLVEYDRPEVLLEVGLAVDRLGVPHSGIEPGELDQEQHDAVRDVFFVSSTVMLVRADLFAELGGFDPRTYPGAEDLDLCWRARIAGARVLVVPDARVRHHQEDTMHDSAEAVSPAAAQRSRLRALLKSASGWSLAYLVPIALFLAVVEVIAFVLTRRRDRASALIGAWTWNLRNLGELRKSRKAAQALRRVPDIDLRSLQVRGSARVSGYLVGSLRAEDRMRSLSERSRSATSNASTRLRAPAAIAALVFIFLFLVGSRSLIFGRVSAIGQLPSWPGIGDLLETFTSAWRYSDLGSSAQAPAQLGLFSALGTVLLGATGLARTIVVVGAFPVGVFGAWRLSRRITGPGSAAVVAALAYGINPVPRNALAAGRFGALVLYALTPIIVSGLLRLGGYLPDSPVKRWWRAVIGTSALVALATAAWPPALLLPIIVAIALAIAHLVARLLARGDGDLRKVWIATLAVTGIGFALLLPWPAAYLRAGDRFAALGFAFRNDLDFSSILRFQTGPNGAGASGWVIAGAALLVLALASGPRLVWATRAWVLALVSFGFVWIPARFFPDAPMPAVEGLLVPAALGISLAVGLGVAAFIEDVRRFHFGWRQVAAVGGAIALSFPILAFAVDATDGRWHMPANDWNQNLSWMRSEDASGQFRVLWLGDPSVLPIDPVVHGDVGYGVTNNGPGDVRTSLPPPAGGASARVGGAVDLLRERGSNRVGALLGPMGVRYLAVPQRPGPGIGRNAPAPPTLLVSLAEQLDLVRLEGPPGLELYENRAWIPGAARLPKAAVTDKVADPLGPVTASGVASPVLEGQPVRPGSILWSQAYDGAWEASSGSATLDHRRVFGFANGYDLTERGDVSFKYTKQWIRYPLVLLELAVVIGAWLIWRGSAKFKNPFRHRDADAAPDAATDVAPDAGELVSMSNARRGRIIVIIVVVGCLLLAAVLDRSGTSEPSSAASFVALGPRVPAEGASETAWYCAEGTSNPGGRADERIFIANVGQRVAHARITVMSGPDQVPTVRALDVAAGSAATIRVAEIVAIPEPGVLVEITGAQAVVTHSIIGNGDAAVGPCARDAAPEWHFAAGTTVRGALLWLALFNPFADDAIVNVAFLTNAGPLAPGELQGFVVPGHSRVTIPVHDQARRDALVATEVTARRGRVVAEQSQVLDGTDGRRGLALSLGSPTLARQWRFPNGSVVAGRTETLVIANPQDTPTTATVHTGLDGGALEPEIVNLPARSSAAVDLGVRVPAGIGFSVRVQSPEPVVAESLTALVSPIPSNARGIATTLGERRAARRWVLVPARVSTTAIDLVAVLNPGPRPLTFRLQARSGGNAITPTDTRRVRLEPGARALLDLGRRQVPPEGLVVIDSTRPVVVSRESSAIPGITVSSAIPDLAAP